MTSRSEYSHWIQYPDFQTKKMEKVDYHGSREVIRTFKWKEVYDKYEKEGKAECPINMGFHKRKEVFTVNSRDGKIFGVFFDYPIKKKFGPIPHTQRKNVALNGIALEEALKYHKIFFEKDYETIHEKVQSLAEKGVPLKKDHPKIENNLLSEKGMFISSRWYYLVGLAAIFLGIILGGALGAVIGIVAGSLIIRIGNKGYSKQRKITLVLALLIGGSLLFIL